MRGTLRNFEPSRTKTTIPLPVHARRHLPSEGRPLVLVRALKTKTMRIPVGRSGATGDNEEPARTEKILVRSERSRRDAPRSSRSDCWSSSSPPTRCRIRRRSVRWQRPSGCRSGACSSGSRTRGQSSAAWAKRSNPSPRASPSITSLSLTTADFAWSTRRPSLTYKAFFRKRQRTVVFLKILFDSTISKMYQFENG